VAGEILKPDGTIDQATMRPGKHVSYVLRGSTREAPEVWWPRFWYCGSRYWQVDALDPAGAPLGDAALLRAARAVRRAAGPQRDRAGRQLRVSPTRCSTRSSS
jgi:hypothetical protein